MFVLFLSVLQCMFYIHWAFWKKIPVENDYLSTVLGPSNAELVNCPSSDPNLIQSRLIFNRQFSPSRKHGNLEGCILSASSTPKHRVGMNKPYEAVLTTQLHRYIDHAPDGFSFALKLVIRYFSIYPVIAREDDSQISQTLGYRKQSTCKKLILPRSYLHHF